MKENLAKSLVVNQFRSLAPTNPGEMTPQAYIDKKAVGALEHRQRVFSQDEEIADAILKTNAISEEKRWDHRMFHTFDDKINEFILYLHKYPENQSQIIYAFEEYYFCEKPVLKVDLLKRILVHGYMQKDGLFQHLKSCHQDTTSIKTKALLNFISKLMDNNKSHQVDDVKQIWKTQKYTFIQECRLDVIINAEQSLKEYAFNLLMIYLEGKVFAAENILKDPLAL